ncbi:membrane protein DedA with SNARE-associated domain [Planomicrobium soli]|uniref:Membrane protein DedA with SNARE-associated domain n=1 Tax=Planomicrobium soli TaxID=1176648 RepID=A0A2P8H6Q3_9BACL|nr:DedA family protein [Planomicrobium soli]PSL41880.1 membrane protein DedA with SNARE-associated domain [Planomicrobium soli]
MDIKLLVELVNEYGYFAMFIFNWILILGVPIPNEVAAAFSGMLTELSYFNPFYAFLSAYLGLISSNTFAYFIGRLFGSRLIRYLNRTKMKKVLEGFSVFLEKRGSWAISLSFFLPGIRWAMPYVVGANRFSFSRYILYAYPAGSIWMFIYFNLGRTFPYAYRSILEHIKGFSITLSILVALFFIGRFFYQSKGARK